MLKKINLVKGREQSLYRKHPWVFSGAIKKADPNIKDGELVEILDDQRHFLGIGHYQSGASIAVRMLTFNREDIDLIFWKKILEKSISYRNRLGLLDRHDLNAYRLFHGEGDGISGLIIDYYNGVVVVQCHSLGIYQHRKDIASALKELLEHRVSTIYCRAKDTLHQHGSQIFEDEFLFGNQEETTIQEYGRKFKVNVVEGQKTGFFLDQRENRMLVSQYVQNKSVLNAFCYTGGFSVYALTANAKSVDSVDISEKAMHLTDENVGLNASKDNHRSITANVLPYLSDENCLEYDVVIVDPPAFAKSLQKRHNAVQAYKRLNALALKKVRPGGFLFTFSCSQVVTTQLFYDTMVAAGLESGRNIRVVKHLSQGPDHPVNLYHPEGHYLKGLMLFVE
jgi:23S rRNA (cytosine1962-C5)-methyltransferase